MTITCETEGATIHYTTDGTEPTAESPVYSEAIAVGETMTIKAIAMKEDMTNSAIASATYTINIPQVATPTFDPAQGEYTEAQNVTITCETEGAAIREPRLQRGNCCWRDHDHQGHRHEGRHGQ